jgi:glycosyltransferase involved in cell wall biosynthesis
MSESAATHPLVTVIIPTYGRREALARAVADLAGQDYADLEVLIVDQTPEADVDHDWVRALPPDVHYHHREHPNLPAARNFGLTRARGDIVIFIDDDVRLPAPFVGAHARNYEDPAVMAVAGPVLSRERRWKTRRPRGVDHPVYGSWGGCWQYDKRIPVKHAPGGNHSCRREVYARVGNYDENYEGPGLREESDFFLRVSRAGFPIVYDPACWLVHLPGDDSGGCRLGGERRQFEERCVNHAYFVLKNFPRHRVRLFFHHACRCLCRTDALRHPGKLPRKMRALVKGWSRAGRLLSREGAGTLHA